jgi:D-beta-D-heptose 7-phosphate kinase/D-beta-D-heptose 1-phosphate adenosyltransferase
VIVDSNSSDYGRVRGASVITPNRTEAAAAAGFAIHDRGDGMRAARVIRERYGIDAVVVTLGEQGMAFVAADDADVIPTQARQVYDVTGAGDSVVAALSVALGRGLSIRRSCLLANAAAGLQVARVGTSRITWGEMLSALESQPPAAHGKVVTRAELREAVQRARAEGKRIGFTNGCFDILHHGHVKLLEAAAAECDLLVVGVNSDASVTRLKGAPRPFVPAAERQAVLAGLSSVGLVCEFSEDTPLELVRAVEPDVLVKGADYAPEQVVGADFVIARGGRVVTPVFVRDASTTGIVERIRRANPDGGLPAVPPPCGAPSRP